MYKQQDGFTLIEIITSLAVLSIIIVGLLPIFPQIMSWSSQSENHLTANHLLTRVANDVEQHANELPLDTVLDEGRLTLSGSELDVLPAYDYDVTLHITYDAIVDLYQTNIQILSDTGTVLCESYTYVKGANAP